MARIRGAINVVSFDFKESLKWCVMSYNSITVFGRAIITSCALRAPGTRERRVCFRFLFQF